jgi:uncharacterized protein
VQDMAEAIRARATNGHSSLLVAGFCWPWSNPDSSGQPVDDVKLARFSMPWNAMPDAGKLAPGIPKSNFWASDPNGVNQVGCVYTARDLNLIMSESYSDGTWFTWMGGRETARSRTTLL